MFRELLTYIGNLIAVMIFLTMFLELLPDGSYRKYVRFFAGVLFFALLLRPVMTTISPDALEERIVSEIRAAEQVMSETPDLEEMSILRDRFYQENAYLLQKEEQEQE